MKGNKKNIAVNPKNKDKDQLQGRHLGMAEKSRHCTEDNDGDEDSLLGLNVLYEVLSTMSVIMSPFTPFFTEYLYQHLRKLHPNYKNADPSVPVDSFGKSDSVHFLMLPTFDESQMNRRAEERFKTLQTAVTLARLARERRHIRNNLPLKNVIVVAANPADIEALEYLKPYLVGEINAWNVTMSTEWEKHCSLKVQPNWKDLGKRLGGQMKAVAKAINELSFAQIVDFMKSGELLVCGFTLTKEDIVVKREFNGDVKKYEACVSDDGGLMIAIDTTCDEELIQELRSRQVVAAVQKLRKSAGLVVADKVDVFYEIFSDKPDSESAVTAAYKTMEECLRIHNDTVVMRLKQTPQPVSRKSAAATVVKMETIDDSDICKELFNLYLTVPEGSSADSA